MAKTIPLSSGTRDRPHWLPWSAFPFQSRFVDIAGKRIHYIDEGSGPAVLFASAGQWSFMFRDVITRLRGRVRCLALDFPGCGLSPDVPGHDHSIWANAQILEGFIDALDLQDIIVAVHDVGGPLGFLVAARRPERFRALVISNTFGWPLASYPTVRHTLKVIANPLMAEVERSLRTTLAYLPVLTLFGRKNDRYGWQDRFARIIPHATAAGIDDGHHFPFNDDPDIYSAAISAWWAEKVATDAGNSANL